MFLKCICALLQIIVYVLQFIEDHSVLVGVVTSVTVSSLWLGKFIRQKRAEAFFGFYAKLSLRLRALQTRLDENGRLNVSDSKAGNIYTLIYEVNYIRTACPKFADIDSKELKAYKVATAELKKILIETDSNVYPPGAKRKKWYDSQHILFSFCEFIENDEYQHTTNQQYSQGESEAKHIVKCRLLVNAIDYIQNSINNAKY